MRHARTQRRSRLRTVVATVVTVVAEAEAEEATAAGVAQATWARPYPLLPPTPLCVEGGYGKCATHARAAGSRAMVRMGYVYRPPQVVNQGLGLQMQPQKSCGWWRRVRGEGGGVWRGLGVGSLRGGTAAAITGDIMPPFAACTHLWALHPKLPGTRALWFGNSRT